jgi:thiamine pyrophosphokinase
MVQKHAYDMIPLLHDYQTVILADGSFPSHAIPLSFLQTAHRIICCDGATEQLLAFGREPDHIVGDLDSISEELQKRFAHILFPDADQEVNDLTKAVRFCRLREWKGITLLGTTGKREDHTLGNLSLLADYATTTPIQLLTDHGAFHSIHQSEAFESFPGQQVSIFSLTPDTLFTTRHLVYPLNKRPLRSWWQGTLNESGADSFELCIDRGKVLVFREHQT